MDFGHVAMQMVTVSLPILLGWAVAKLGIMSETFERELSRLVLTVALPCLILSSVFGSDELPDAADTFQLMAGTILIYAVSLIVALAITALMRAPKGSESVYRFAIMFGNCGFIGFPVITAVLGERALLYAAVSLIPANLVIYTVGLMFFTGFGGGWRKVAGSLASCLKTPTLIASIAVLFCLLLGLTDWGFVGDSISIVGDMTTPAALLLMGASISHYKPVSMLANWRAYVAAAGRLVIAPLAGFAALRLCGIDPYIAAIIVIEAAMPVATNGTLFSIQYDADTLPMMQTTFLSIIGAILTIPLVTVITSI